MKKTPLQAWISDRIHGHDDLTLPLQIASYHLDKLREIVAYVRAKSPFYRDLFAGVGDYPVQNFEAFARLPFTSATDLSEHGLKMLCTSQDEIERVVTLQTSGTTGSSKRLFFTVDDLEATIDFFAHGMSTLVEPGSTVIIFLPGAQRDSVGELLARALARTKVKAVIHGPVRDAEAARAVIMQHPRPCLVGIPTQMLGLARGDLAATIPKGWVQSILLSTDYVPASIERELELLWGCRVLTHYGMTETGLGGGVECDAGEGYHLREADLYTEIVDPVTGMPVPDGIEGEVVVTTLTRRGMPLIRYRTGDRASFLTEPCPCGSLLRRLGPVQGRFVNEVALKDGERLRMSALDEVLFDIPGILDFTAIVTGEGMSDRLHLAFQTVPDGEKRVARSVEFALGNHRLTRKFFKNTLLEIGSVTFNAEGWAGTGVAKRQIQDRRWERDERVDFERANVA